MALSSKSSDDSLNSVSSYATASSALSPRYPLSLLSEYFDQSDASSSAGSQTLTTSSHASKLLCPSGFLHLVERRCALGPVLDDANAPVEEKTRAVKCFSDAVISALHTFLENKRKSEGVATAVNFDPDFDDEDSNGCIGVDSKRLPSCISVASQEAVVYKIGKGLYDMHMSVSQLLMRVEAGYPLEDVLQWLDSTLQQVIDAGETYCSTLPQSRPNMLVRKATRPQSCKFVERMKTADSPATQASLYSQASCEISSSDKVNAPLPPVQPPKPFPEHMRKEISLSHPHEQSQARWKHMSSTAAAILKTPLEASSATTSRAASPTPSTTTSGTQLVAASPASLQTITAASAPHTPRLRRMSAMSNLKHRPPTPIPSVPQVPPVPSQYRAGSPAVTKCRPTSSEVTYQPTDSIKSNISVRSFEGVRSTLRESMALSAEDLANSYTALADSTRKELPANMELADLVDTIVDAHLVSEHESLGTDCVAQFLLTFRTFATPNVVFNLLAARFARHPLHKADLARAGVLRVMLQWLELFWVFEWDNQALGDLRQFCDGPLNRALAEPKGCVDPAEAARLRSLLGRRHQVRGFRVQRLPPPLSSPISDVHAMEMADALMANKDAKWDGYGKLSDSQKLELAQHLTVVAHERISQMMRDPMTMLCLAHDDLEFAGAKDSLQQYFGFQRGLMLQVMASIISENNTKKRAAIMGAWIDIAKLCEELRNFDCMFFIVTALNHHSIWRLKFTQLLSRQMQKLTITQKENYRDVNELIKDGAISTYWRLKDRDTPDDAKLPTVPLLAAVPAILVRAGESVCLVKDLINWKSAQRLAEVHDEMRRCYDTPYKFPPCSLAIRKTVQHLVTPIRREDEEVLMGFYESQSIIKEPEDSLLRLTQATGRVPGNFNAYLRVPVGRLNKYKTLPLPDSRPLNRRRQTSAEAR
ncbi:ras GEF [Fistulina hepatica ATCC 64428]|uniref:Ras GEF n=1 Tax=Fistulina hepatica ATCC 64428 TaxID=1128425 RepID=A0A0D7A468_9AGAR|nr:ras GEF [Fistulina hepatica ATCC 64428]